MGAGWPHPGCGLAQWLTPAWPGWGEGSSRAWEAQDLSSGHLASLDVSPLVCNSIRPSEGLTLGPGFTAAQFIQEIVMVGQTLCALLVGQAPFPALIFSSFHLLTSDVCVAPTLLYRSGKRRCLGGNGGAERLTCSRLHSLSVARVAFELGQPGAQPRGPASSRLLWLPALTAR